MERRVGPHQDSPISSAEHHTVRQISGFALDQIVPGCSTDWSEPEEGSSRIMPHDEQRQPVTEPAAPIVKQEVMGNHCGLVYDLWRGVRHYPIWSTAASDGNSRMLVYWFTFP